MLLPMPQSSCGVSRVGVDFPPSSFATPQVHLSVLVQACPLSLSVFADVRNHLRLSNQLPTAPDFLHGVFTCGTWPTRHPNVAGYKVIHRHLWTRCSLQALSKHTVLGQPSTFVHGAHATLWHRTASPKQH